MKRHLHLYASLAVFRKPGSALWIQAPLPHCVDTPPILLTIEGPGSALAGSAPLAPPEKPANEN